MTDFLFRLSWECFLSTRCETGAVGSLSLSLCLSLPPLPSRPLSCVECWGAVVSTGCRRVLGAVVVDAVPCFCQAQQPISGAL